ncbi:Outer membrane efflux protein [Pirellulimonas nuda]|uniref:Outer membrane efflux protein n=1 Tax=Pirellulimonas nuda TaxID=2528009 RepID=A0A518DA06_9BACT|nr:TolC family protein [Pirellulimonas nuda]QDU88256.1 Outer membrane efflux protein [Pirellulimonas nuda]
MIRIVSLLLLVALAPSLGCTRAHYRRQADNAASLLIAQKAAPVGADPSDLSIAINPASRMYNVYDPDRPPMPPDDPVSHMYLERVDGKRGARSSRLAPRTPFVESPQWRAMVPLDEEGMLVLDSSQAVRVALLHSPEYQSNLEDLYLSALDVSFERFRFDCQFFGGTSTFYTADGRVRSGTGESSSLLNVSPLRPGNRLRAERLTATGGQLVVGMANSLIWQFAGPNDYTSTTLLDFSIIQPLLRFGGRTRVLERLTISERALLANVRTMERYRRGFYLNVLTGRNAGQGPSRRGGFFGGAGLEGFTGVGGGGFGRVGQFGNFGGGGGQGFTGGAGAEAAGGYYGLLQSAQVLRNQLANVEALRESVEQLVATYDAGRIDRFQVDLARQALFNAQSQYLLARANYQSQFDNFKITLGLPPDIRLKLTDPMLEQFELRSAELVELQGEVNQSTVAQTDPPQELPGQGGAPLEAPPADGSAVEPLPLPPGVAEAVPAPVPSGRFEKLAAQAAEQFASVEQDFAKLQEVLPQRQAHLKLLADRPEVVEAGIDPALLSAEGLDRRVEALRADLDATTERFEKLVASASEPAQAGLSASRAERARTRELSGLLLELSLLQARARLDAIDIEPTELTPEQALGIASRNRRDWMNARASLVDAWRLVNFNANDLKSDLSLIFSGDIGNVGDNPFDLRSTNGRLRVGVEFDAPLTRVAERNVYVQALIEYQQARRSYYRYVDGVYQGLRATLRQIRLNEINLELRRAAVLVAIAQVDITQLRLTEPPRPGEDVAFGDTTARDLVNALGDLLNVQNDLLSVWVNNVVQRMSLEFDLGLMQLDQYGIRVPLPGPLASYVGPPCCGPSLEFDGGVIVGVGPECEGVPGGAPVDGEAQRGDEVGDEAPYEGAQELRFPVEAASYQQPVLKSPFRRLPEVVVR